MMVLKALAETFVFLTVIFYLLYLHNLDHHIEQQAGHWIYVRIIHKWSPRLSKCKLTLKASGKNSTEVNIRALPYKSVHCKYVQ